MTDDMQRIWLKRAIAGMLIGTVVTLAYLVLDPFLVPVSWAAIVAFVTWPLYRRLCRAIGGCGWQSALLMVVALSVVIVLPLFWLSTMLRAELVGAYRALAAYVSTGPHQLPEIVAGIPWLGPWLQEWLNHYTGNPELLRADLGRWVESSLGELFHLIGGAGRNLVKLTFAVLALFFLYRDGAALVEQIRRALQPFVGPPLAAYLEAIGATIKAVVYGLIATALAQGTLAALGYWLADVRAPASFGALTAFVALIPFGAPLVWGPIGVGLLFTGKTVAGVGLLLWGLLAVSWIDNLLRPLVISSATRIPFLLVLFGVIGGLSAFGLIGLFLGPVILAVLLAIWRQWVGAQPAAQKP